MNSCQEIDRELFKYPGQLSVIALCIVTKYDNYEAASKNCEEPMRWCSRALADSDIPGAGGTVAASLDYLKYIRDGHLKEALAYEERVWANEERTFDKTNEGRPKMEIARKRLFELLKTKWGWNVENLNSDKPVSVIEALNELSKPEKSFSPEEVRQIAWSGVGRLKDAESLLMEFLVDQETLAPNIQNSALVEKGKAFFGIKD